MRAFHFFCLPIALTLAGGCHNRSPGDGSPILARVGDAVITARALEARVGSFGRARYLMDHDSKPEKKKELLNTLIESEALYQEARRLGYDRDPAVKREAVNRMLQNEVDSRVNADSISDADVEKYYQAHPNEFSRPDQVRVSQIVVKDRRQALKVAAEAKTLPKGNSETWRALVNKYSEDEASRARGGDLGTVDRSVTSMPKPVVEAAFALAQMHDVSEPIQTEHGYAVLILTQKQPGFSKTLAEAKPGIQSRLLYERRQQKRVSLTAEIRQRAPIEIDEAQLAALKFPVSATGTSVGDRLGPPPGGPGPVQRPGAVPGR
jgi:peptidyl-prolyl cis-trans isomerase C